MLVQDDYDSLLPWCQIVTQASDILQPHSVVNLWKQTNKMYNSTSDENISISDDHIGFDIGKEEEYIDEEFLPGNHTEDYCLVRSY